MYNQLVIDDYEQLEFESEIRDFEFSQIDNENEEDINNISKMSFSDLAVTGTDWTVETLVGQIKKGNIQLNPSFQRRDAWSGQVKSRFIESIFLGLPIPQIILAEQKGKKGKFIVIDGKQRLLSLKQFALPDDNESALKLTGLDVLSKFNRMSYQDILDKLYYDEIDAFNNQTIRTVVIKNWKNVEVLYLLFLRLNTGSIKLSPQELRQALYPGKFIDYVNKESSTNKYLQKMMNIKKADFRMRDVEIMIRYFSFYFFADKYTGSMQNFLDMTCEKLNNSFDALSMEIKKAVENFNSAVDLTFRVFEHEAAFKKFKNGKYEDRYNRAVIDIMLYYFSKADKEHILIKKSQIVKAFETLCSEDLQFISSLETTTKSLPSVHYRFEKWGKELSTITEEALNIPEGY